MTKPNATARMAEGGGKRIFEQRKPVSSKNGKENKATNSYLKFSKELRKSKCNN